MKVLVIGGTGFISGALVQLLASEGHEVSLFTRGLTKPTKPIPERVHTLTGDRRSFASLQKHAAGKNFDAVFDMVAYTPEESAAAAKIFAGNVGRFIHCSTISVYMVSHDVLCPITEDQDRRPLMEFFPQNPFGMEYGINKRLCEEALWKAHDERRFPVSMLRPTFVCGPHDPARRDLFWIERILDGKPLLIPGSGDHAFQSVFVEDVAHAFLSLLECPQSIGRAYNIAGEEIFSLNEYLRRLGRLLEREPELIHVDQEVFDRDPLGVHPQGDVFPFNTRRTAVFSLELIKRDLGYHSTPFDEWMELTVNQYGKKNRGRSVGYERRDEEIRFLEKWKVQTGEKFTKNMKTHAKVSSRR